jgi:hypothetical protein
MLALLTRIRMKGQELSRACTRLLDAGCLFDSELMLTAAYSKCHFYRNYLG